ncbi:MAG TPA: hypothetical protein VFH06_00670 [Candidatus Saccharimonadales bacterium]|nr:hypothetical protein [Candidatus Saccharimonadales bacterium]
MTGQSPEFYKPPTFREVEPIPQWSARLEFDMPYDEFIVTTLAAAAEAQHRYTGTLTRDSHTGNVTSFTRTRFPRNKYGLPPGIVECEAGVQYLAEKLGAVHLREAHQPGTSRIVLGLYEGQHATGARTDADGPDHSVQEIVALLGEDAIVQQGEVFSARLDSKNGSVSHYSEDIAEIIFPTVEKQRVYLLGDAMKQERFSVEDFTGDNNMWLGGQSYMVETQYCKEPDPSQPVEK